MSIQIIRQYRRGELIRTIEVEAPDPEPTPQERIADLEAQVTRLNAAMTDLGNASDFAAAKQAVQARIDRDTSAPDEPVKGDTGGRTSLAAGD